MESTSPSDDLFNTPTSGNSNSRSPFTLLNHLVNSFRSPSKRNAIHSSKSKEVQTDRDTMNSTMNNTSKPSTSKPRSKCSSNRVTGHTYNKGNTPASTDNRYTCTSVSVTPTEQTAIKEVIDDDNRLTVEELEKSVQSLRDKYNAQVDKNTRCEQEIDRLKTAVKVQSEKHEKVSAELNKVRSDLGSCNGKLQTALENNTQLKDRNHQLNEEKADLVNKYIRLQESSELTNTKLQHVTTNLEMAIATEMANIKRNMTKELVEIKAQISSVCNRANDELYTSRSASGDVIGVNQKSSAASKDKTRPVTSKPDKSTVNQPKPDSEHTNINQKHHSVFIAGDSTTRRLSPTKMSDKSIKVKIKSQPGGTVETLHRIIEDGGDSISKTDVIILHAGTNDISSGEDPDNVVMKLENIVKKVKHTCPDSEIVVSSILPKKSEQVVNKIIHKTNQSISNMCQNNNCHFLNNDLFAMKNGKPDYSLLYDNVHLNQTGIAVFGNHIMKTINCVLFAHYNY